MTARASNRRLLVLPGDGVGPEIMAEARRVLDWLQAAGRLSVEVDEDLIGGCAYDRHGTPLSDQAFAKALAADAVLMGAVGGPQWDDVARHHRPEAGVLRLRKEMDLFANLRPVACPAALAGASTLYPEIVSGLDMVIIRELTSGVYFGEPRGIETRPDGTRRAVDTQAYTEHEIERVCRVGFELAGERTGKLHSVEKANVMETGVLWRAVATEMGRGYPGIELHHMYADNCAMQLVRNPRQFDVIVTDNLFGDILSDCAAMLTGSLGMLPSASLGAVDESGRRRALYEPVHGSAPDIAGRGIANPIATVLSLAMCLRHTFDQGEEATLVERAVEGVLSRGLRTADIMQSEATQVTTAGMGQALIEELDRLSA